MSLQAGRLRHRIQIQRRVALLDSNGQEQQDPNTGEVAYAWELFHECWAAIEPLSAREFIQSQAIQSQVTARIVIRAFDGVSAAMRILHTPIGRATVVYNIAGILRDKDSGIEYMTLPVSEGVNSEGA